MAMNMAADRRFRLFVDDDDDDDDDDGGGVIFQNRSCDSVELLRQQCLALLRLLMDDFNDDDAISLNK